MTDGFCDQYHFKRAFADFNLHSALSLFELLEQVVKTA